MDQIQVPKWKRIPLPDDIFSMSFSAYNMVSDVSERIEVEDVFPDRMNIEKTLGASFESYNMHGAARNMTIRAKRSFDLEIASFKINLKDGDYLENIHIEGQAGANAMIILEYTQSEAIKSNMHQRIQVSTAPSAKVQVVVIQRLSKQSRYFSQQVAYVDENADVKISTFALGGGLQALSVEEHLLGRHSNGHIRLAYLITEDQLGDFSNTIYHEAPQTQSTILAKGVLRDTAKKVYRGNLFFENGSAQSVGREEEFAILLNDGVRSDSIPALLCKEDDVIGEHACSAGQIDKEQLFYVMSRGYSKAEAELLIVLSSFTEMMMDLPDQVRDSLEEWIKRRIHHETAIPHI